MTKYRHHITDPVFRQAYRALALAYAQHDIMSLKKSEYVHVDRIREAIADCPVCYQQLNDGARIPRRLSCCSQTVCTSCLQQIYKLHQPRLPCPMCRHEHHLHRGIEALPKETLILKILGTLESTDSGNTDSLKKNLKEKTAELNRKIRKLTVFKDNLAKSKETAIEEINSLFDEMVGEIQERRSILLAEVEATAQAEAVEVTKVLASVTRLMNRVSSARDSLGRPDGVSRPLASDLLDESPEDVRFLRTGVTFVPTEIEKLLVKVRNAGLIKLVRFCHTPRPDYVPDSEPYFLISASADETDIEPTPAPVAHLINDDMDEPIPVTSPYLELDTSTCSRDITVMANGLFTNVNPQPPVKDTGCRLETWRRVMSGRPLDPGQFARHLYTMKVQFILRKQIEEGFIILEKNLTTMPLDADWGNPEGLRVQIGVCRTDLHENKLCLAVLSDSECLYEVPVVDNQAGAGHELHLGFLVDGVQKTAHVIDMTTATELANAPISEDLLWVMIHVETPDWLEIAGHLESGDRVSISPPVFQLLGSILS